MIQAVTIQSNVAIQDNSRTQVYVQTQGEIITLLVDLSYIETMTEDSITESDISYQDFMEVPNLAGARPNTKKGDRTASVILTRQPDSNPEHHSSEPFPSSLTRLQNNRERQERYAQRLRQR